ncbi:hypothetical protein [Romboutsia sp.]|uniref:hypothetical protein n=1 Tax=Romboutsia sp. TaxID=1965302 RepID=UPI002CCD8B22|nr:hypothetical protein [Romboutsia sp.]HSQ87576.1 hypothetical protein [Romboutsia sp.]
MVQSLFENRKMRIEYIEDRISETTNRMHIFKVCIKDFDTPILNIEYDSSEDIISKTYIENDELANIPKSHVAYKMFSLMEYQVLEIMRFIIKHL